MHRLRNDPLSWRELLAPVVAELDLPASCYRILGALYELQEDRYLTVYGGREAVVARTRLHPRTVERGLKRLRALGVIYAAEPSVGGRLPADERTGLSKGRANGYELGPLAMQPRSNDRGSTPVERPPLELPNPGQTTGVQPRSNDRPRNPGQTTGVQPRSNDRPSPPQVLNVPSSDRLKKDARPYRPRDRARLSPDALQGPERIDLTKLRDMFGEQRKTRKPR